jgi:hypothetical protein
MKALFKHTSIPRPIRPLTDEQINEAKEHIRLRNEKYKREEEIRDQYILVMISGMCPVCGSDKIKVTHPIINEMYSTTIYKYRKCKLKVGTENQSCPR